APGDQQDEDVGVRVGHGSLIPIASAWKPGVRRALCEDAGEPCAVFVFPSLTSCRRQDTCSPGGGHARLLEPADTGSATRGTCPSGPSSRCSSSSAATPSR